MQVQDCHIRARIVPYYPHLLAKQLERDICPVLSHLSSMGCSQQDIRLLVGVLECCTAELCATAIAAGPVPLCAAAVFL
jgi:hypothetical protein